MLVRVSLAVAISATVLTGVPVMADRPSEAWSARPATFGVHSTLDVPVTMGDGVVLSVDVHRPAEQDGQPAPGRFPVLMTQTPYNSSIQDPKAPYFVERGYVDLVVDIRGTGTSGGRFGSFDRRSQLDGKELVAWAASQDWSDGAVGLRGGSYLGINQLLTAAQQPPALKAIFPIVPTGDNYRSVLPGGYLTSLAAFAVQNVAVSAPPPAYALSDPQRAAATLSTRPQNAADVATYLAETMSGGARAFDGPYYRDGSPLWKMDTIDVPTFLVGGWYDALSQRDVPLMFTELQQRKVPVRMLMGPWYHTNPGEGLPTQGILPLDELQLRWFDRHVRGVGDPELDRSAPATWYRLGEDRYHFTKAYPSGVVYERLSLTENGALTRDTGSGAPDILPWTQVSGACTRSTYIGTFGLAPSTPCETDNSLNDNTGLVYETPSLQEPLDLAGAMSAHLFISSSRSDAFLTLHVESVDPATGVADELTSGWDTLSFRELDTERSRPLGDAGLLPFHPYTRESVQPLQADTVYDWWVEIRDVAARIPAGHKLRLSIQTSDTVRFLPTVPRLADSVGAVVTVHHDAERPSGLVLPVQPARGNKR